MRLVLALGVVALLGAFASQAQPGVREQPPGVLASEPPQQTAPATNATPIERDGFVLSPVAGFQLDARVLGRRDYEFGTEAELSPMDLALGWGRMSDSTVIDQLEITQGDRWYSYAYPAFSPITPEEILTSSANMHMIPANDFVRRQLEALVEGDVVTLGGHLVNVERPRDGFRWNTSISREDTGGGSCEIVLVDWVRVR